MILVAEHQEHLEHAVDREHGVDEIVLHCEQVLEHRVVERRVACSSVGPQKFRLENV